MGWWNIGKRKDATMGDTTADEVTRAVGEIADNLKKQKKKLPTFAGYAQTITDLLTADFAAYVSDKKPQAELDELLKGIKLDGEALDADSKKILKDALTQVSSLYESEIERKPTVVEVFANVHFSMSGDPEKYMSDNTGFKDLQKKILEQE